MHGRSSYRKDPSDEELKGAWLATKPMHENKYTIISASRFKAIILC